MVKRTDQCLCKFLISLDHTSLRSHSICSSTPNIATATRSHFAAISRPQIASGISSASRFDCSPSGPFVELDIARRLEAILQEEGLFHRILFQWSLPPIKEVSGAILACRNWLKPFVTARIATVCEIRWMQCYRQVHKQIYQELLLLTLCRDTAEYCNL